MIHVRENNPAVQRVVGLGYQERTILHNLKSIMDGPTSTQEDSKSPQEAKIDSASSKRRKAVQKTLVTVRVEATAGKQKGEGPPSDFWSWRKYGQKPIKGSPYPRGYYRCSTSKGCSAKKQVERCRTDSSVLIITYTSNHSHPGPDLTSINLTNGSIQNPPAEEACPAPDSPKQPTTTCEAGLNREMPLPRCSQDTIPPSPQAGEEVEKAHDHSNIPYSNMVALPTPKSSEENDFFDELEELPISSSFTGLMRNSFFDERILLLPSWTTTSS